VQKGRSAGSSADESTAPISFADACSIIATHARDILDKGGRESVTCDLAAALGCRLAVPLVADRDQPPFARVTRDGYAVRASDVNSGISLRVIGQVRAGEAWPSGNPPISAEEAIEIMTGAPLPPGADAVLMVEHAQKVQGKSDGADRTQSQHQRFVRPLEDRHVTPGENIVHAGSEARRGDILLEPGSRLGPEAIALAASCGFRSVPVFVKPEVAILATGDELVDASAHAGSSGARSGKTDATIQQHQIYDSNSHALAALVQQAGGTALRQRPARDELDDLAGCIRQGLEAAPLLLLAGGVSLGKFDLVEEVFAGMGAEFFFTGVKMQPGKPVVFGRVPADGARPERYFFGLPGNPVSTMVTFRIFVEPILAALSGERNWQPNIAMATLAAEFRTKQGLTRFVPARLETRSIVPTITPIRTQGSGDLVANARANCYLVVPDDIEILGASQVVRVLLRE
jgi:molybdopterin molybdotransferase